MTSTFGASPSDWSHFDLVLGLTEDLLPVVSNPGAHISPNSKMKGIGKTPSIYNNNRQVAGVSQWTERKATSKDISRWQKESDYGICIQTRTVRGIDIDIADAAAAREVSDAISAHGVHLPRRTRANSGKLLLAVCVLGDIPKRFIKTAHGVVELLATGQQFIACGTHPSGVRYEWLDGLPSAIPEITLDKLNAIWRDLEATFAIEPSTELAKSTKAQQIQTAVSSDPTGQYLLDHNHVLSTERDGRLHIVCPFSADHTTESAESATTYWPAHTGGYEQGHFHCLHAHCADKTDDQFKEALGMSVGMMAEFEDLTQLSDTIEAVQDAAPLRFEVVPDHLFSEGAPPPWLIRNILPEAGLGVVYGDSGSGKTFAVLDMAAHITQGLPWRGANTRKGSVVVIAAEGAGGFRKRLRAQLQQHNVSSLGIGVIGDAPNFMEAKDIKDVVLAVQKFGCPSIIIVDTFAQVMAGANENAGEDVGKALAHCKVLHKYTGAMVILVHHSGKDASKGARGWSGLRAAADVEIEVSRDGDQRAIKVTKLKDGDDEGQAFAFELKQVVIGIDDELEEVTSCVVNHLDKPTPRPGAKESDESIARRVAVEHLDTNGKVMQSILATVVASCLPEEFGKTDNRLRRANAVLRDIADKGVLRLQNGFAVLDKIVVDNDDTSDLV